MNKAITDGLALMPPPFSAGLMQWSREDGTPGSVSYQGQANAAIVPADQDFGGCLELQKLEATQRLRYKGQTPIEPGLYLRVTARVKAVSGALPQVRIAAYAALSNGAPAGVVQTGPQVPLTSYGQVVTISAIVGSGNRQGVDMVWGTAPTYGHFGIDLVGANGGVVRIDDLVIEDVTAVFHRKMMDLVDVRDYGAVGNGIANDAGAFLAADAAADGRTVLVSDGVYNLAANVSMASAVRFDGRITMPGANRLTLTRNYDLDTYASAFGTEAEGFRRGLQALFTFTDHVTFDLSGRRVDLNAPVNVAALSGLSVFAQRRVLANGQLNAVPGVGWDAEQVSAIATYSVADPNRLTGVANIAAIPVGARISGTGVGREVYVTAKNAGAATVTLSRPLWGAAGTRTFTFRRFRYMLDFSGFEALSRFELTGMELQCNGLASGIMLAPEGSTFRLAQSVINRPRDRGITSTGLGCQGMFVEGCQFLSDEQAMPAQDRTTIALNTNANDCKIRDNRVVRFAHFAVIGGGSHLILGNHFFQGDDQTNGVRQAGIVITQTNPRSVVTGNYVDNCFVEWTNEHDSDPAFANEFSFGALTITGNLFLCSDVSSAFRWIVLKPRGAGHFVSGLSVTGNVFRTVNATIDRVERLDTTTAGLDFGRMRNVTFEGNTFNGVTQPTINPVTISHRQNTAADTWTVNGGAFLPFGARALVVQSVMPEGPVLTAGDAPRWDAPHALPEQGAERDRVALRWPSAVKGSAQVTLRCDNPS